MTVGKKINGRKRHIVTDTLGMLLVVSVTAASVQDRVGAHNLIKQLHSVFPLLGLIYADGGYMGKMVDKCKELWNIVLQIVRKDPGQQGFSPLPRRWVVERTFSWLMRWRRLVRDHERLPENHEAMVKLAMIGVMLNRLERPPGPKPWKPKKTEKS